MPLNKAHNISILFIKSSFTYFRSEILTQFRAAIAEDDYFASQSCEPDSRLESDGFLIRQILTLSIMTMPTLTLTLAIY